MNKVFRLLVLVCVGTGLGMGLLIPERVEAKIKCCKRLSKAVSRVGDQISINWDHLIGEVKEQTRIFNDLKEFKGFLVEVIERGIKAVGTGDPTWMLPGGPYTISFGPELDKVFNRGPIASGATDILKDQLGLTCHAEKHHGVYLWCFPKGSAKLAVVKDTLDFLAEDPNVYPELDNQRPLDYVKKGIGILSWAGSNLTISFSCDDAVAYHHLGKDGIAGICSSFFGRSVLDRAATLVHEAAHGNGNLSDDGCNSVYETEARYLAKLAQFENHPRLIGQCTEFKTAWGLAISLDIWKCNNGWGVSNSLASYNGDINRACGDWDHDAVFNPQDSCPYEANLNDSDLDHDGVGNTCDPDIDGDGILNYIGSLHRESINMNNFSGRASLRKSDFIRVGGQPLYTFLPDPGDNCPVVVNPDQKNTDGGRYDAGDACDSDDDDDGVLDVNDNCPLVANADKADFDGDGVGDACDLRQPAAPQLALDLPSGRFGPNRRLKFKLTYTSLQPVSLHYTIDTPTYVWGNNPVASNAWITIPSNLSQSATLTVYSKSAAGVKSPNVQVNLIYDNLSPIEPTINLNPANGHYSTNGLTIQLTPNDTGTEKIYYTTDATVNLTISLLNYIRIGTPLPSTIRLYTPPVLLTGITGNIRAVSVDDVGNISTIIPSASFEYDPYPPGVPNIAIVTTAGTGTLNTALQKFFYSNAISISITPPSNDTTGIFYSFHSDVDFTDLTDNRIQPYPGPLPKSAITGSIYAVARDLAGNVSTVQTADFEYDHIFPSAPNVAFTLTNGTGAFNNMLQKFFYSNTISVAFSNSSGEPVDIFYTFDPSVPFTDLSNSLIFPYQIPISRSAITGSIRAVARDLAGNISNPVQSAAFEYDSAQPSSPNITLTPTTGTGMFSTALQKFFYNNTLSMAISNTSGEIVDIFYTLDPSVSFSDLSHSLIHPYSGAIPRTGVGGTIRAVARDLAGNVSTVQSAAFAFDNQDPVITFLGPPSNRYLENKVVKLTANEDVTFYYTLNGQNPEDGASGLQIIQKTAGEILSISIDQPEVKLRYRAKDFLGHFSLPVSYNYYIAKQPFVTASINPESPYWIVGDVISAIQFQTPIQGIEIFAAVNAIPNTTSDRITLNALATGASGTFSPTPAITATAEIKYKYRLPLINYVSEVFTRNVLFLSGVELATPQEVFLIDSVVEYQPKIEFSLLPATTEVASVKLKKQDGTLLSNVAIPTAYPATILFPDAESQVTLDVTLGDGRVFSKSFSKQLATRNWQLLGGEISAERIDTPNNLALASDGSIYFTVSGGRLVKRLVPSSGLVSTLFREERGVTSLGVNTQGDMFFTVPNEYRIFKRSSLSGAVSNFAGNGLNIGDLNNLVEVDQEGPALEIKIGRPSSISIATNGAIYFVSACRIREVYFDDAAQSWQVRIVTGKGQSVLNNQYCLPREQGDPVELAKTARIRPNHIRLDTQGNLYVLQNGANLLISNNATYQARFGIWRVAWNLNEQQREIETVYVSGTAAQTYFSRPAVFGNTLYFAESYYNNPAYIKKIDLGTSGSTPVNFVYTIQLGAAENLWRIRDFITDSFGNLYAASLHTSAIVKITPATIVTQLIGQDNLYAQGPTGTYEGDGGHISETHFNLPISIRGDHADNLYVLDSGNKAIRKIDPDGIVSTLLYDDHLESSEFALEDSGTLYFIAGHQLKKIENDVISVIAGTGVDAYDTSTEKPALETTIKNVAKISISGSNIYILEKLPNYLDRIRKVNLTTGNISSVLEKYWSIMSHVLLSDDSFYYTFYTSSQVFRGSFQDVDLWASLRIAGVYVSRSQSWDIGKGFSGDGGLATEAKLSRPQYLAVDEKGNLFIDDVGNQRIRKIDHTTGIISTLWDYGLAGFYGPMRLSIHGSTLFLIQERDHGILHSYLE